MAEFLFKDTTATKKIFNLKNRIRSVSGGTSASKTISILVWLIDYAQSTTNEVITVVAESVPHLELGAIRDFKNIMTAHGYWQNDSWISKPAKYTFPKGSIIEFISFDKFGKAHGPRRDVLFLNEANNLPYNIVDQLITRTKKIVWIDFNPTNEFWFYTEMLPNRKDIDFITVNYLDNEALDETIISEIESHKNNKYWWQVYGLGQLGVVEGRVYRDWQIIDEIPHEARLERYGMDFGYSNDPTAIVAVYKYNDGFIFDEVCFQKGLSNKQIADILLNQDKAMVMADSAEPKSIDEIKSYGVNIFPAIKGQGSVNKGIQYVQDQKCSITKRSINIIKEYRNYLFKEDKNGKVTNEPQAGFDHSMDAIRYALDSYKPAVNQCNNNNKPNFI